ncbi:MAG: oligosaccharide flippase family protein [Lachnospiraceae bacterium]
MKSKYKELIKNIIIFSFGGLGSKIILFLLVPLYTRYLTTEEYGTADLVFTFSQLLIPVASLTIQEAVMRFGLSKDEDRIHVLQSAFFIWIVGSVVSTAFIPLLSFTSISKYSLYLIVYVILSSGSQIFLNYLKVIDKNRLYSIITIVQTLFLAIFNVILVAQLKLGIVGYLMANNIAIAVCFFLSVCFSGVAKVLEKFELDKSLTIKMLIYSLPLILNNISWWAIHSIDKIMITCMISASALGIYTVSSKIPSLINVFTGFFNQAFGLSAIKEKESTNEIDFYSKIFNYYYNIVILGCIIVNTFIKVFMKYYTSSAYFESWRYVPILMVAAVFNAMASYFGSLYCSLKLTNNNMITTLISALLNIIFNFSLISIVGLSGAAYGTLIAYFSLTYIRVINIRKHMKFSINWLKHGLILLILFLHLFITVNEFHHYILSAILLFCWALMNKNELRDIIKIHR